MLAGRKSMLLWKPIIQKMGQSFFQWLYTTKPPLSDSRSPFPEPGLYSALYTAVLPPPGCVEIQWRQHLAQLGKVRRKEANEEAVTRGQCSTTAVPFLPPRVSSLRSPGAPGSPSPASPPGQRGAWGFAHPAALL